MANVKFLKNKQQPFDDYDPFEFVCTFCGKTKVYTEEEIDNRKKPYPDPQNHDYDFFISCPFCTKGVMEPPTFISFFGAFEELDEE